MPHRIAGENLRTAALDVASQKVLEVREFDDSLGVHGYERFGGVLNDFSSELESVLAAQNRDVLQNLQAAVGSDVFGPIASQPEIGAVKGADLQERKTEVPLVGHTGVNPIGERIDARIVGITELAVIGVAHPEFIHQS